MLDLTITKNEGGVTSMVAHVRLNDEDPSRGPEIRLMPDIVTFELLKDLIATIEQKNRVVAELLARKEAK